MKTNKILFQVAVMVFGGIITVQAQDWSLSGNGGTTPGFGVGQSYFGTSDAVNVLFGRGATHSGFISNTSTAFGMEH